MVMEETRKDNGNRISSVITWEYEKQPTYTSFTDLLASSIVIVVYNDF